MTESSSIKREETFIRQHMYVLQIYIDDSKYENDEDAWLTCRGFETLNNALEWFKYDSPNLLRDRRILIPSLHCALYYRD
jgi:hypothetical protein